MSSRTATPCCSALPSETKGSAPPLASRASPRLSALPMKYWEDLPVGRVETFGGKFVEREEVLDFARKFDPQAFHLDDDAAAANPMFGRLAASGFHTASM